MRLPDRAGAGRGVGNGRLGFVKRGENVANQLASDVARVICEADLGGPGAREKPPRPGR